MSFNHDNSHEGKVQPHLFTNKRGQRMMAITINGKVFFGPVCLMHYYTEILCQTPAWFLTRQARSSDGHEVLAMALWQDGKMTQVKADDEDPMLEPYIVFSTIEFDPGDIDPINIDHLPPGLWKSRSPVPSPTPKPELQKVPMAQRKYPKSKTKVEVTKDEAQNLAAWEGHNVNRRMTLMQSIGGYVRAKNFEKVAEIAKELYPAATVRVDPRKAWSDPDKVMVGSWNLSHVVMNESRDLTQQFGHL